MSTSPHAFLTSVLCALWPPACLCPARGDLVEAYLCQRSGKGLQCSVCSKRQGVCLAEKRWLWSADIDWTKDQRGMAMYSVHCSQPGRRGGDQTRARGGGEEGVEFRNKRANRRAPNGARVRLCHRQVLDGSAGHAGAVHGPRAGRKSRFLAGSRGKEKRSRAAAMLTVCGVAEDPTDGQPLVPLEARFRPIARSGRS